MAPLAISIATADYDHFRDIALGRIPVEGCTLNYQIYPIEETFFRFTRNREWDVSELSFAKFVAIMSKGDADIVGLPVFPSRVFRLASVYVRKGSHIERGEDLRGKRIGLPEWAQTAAIYTRGWMTDDLGIPLSEVKWYQAGLNQPGRREQVAFNLPEGVKITAEPDRSLRDMLETEDLDAVFSARPPDGSDDPDSRIQPLFRNPVEVETAYFKRTGIFPIMHTVAIRRDIYEKNRWLAGNLYKAFQEARRTSLTRLSDRQASRYFAPWIADYVAAKRGILGSDYFPYGIEENRTTLDVYLRWCFEQGIAKHLITPEDLFAPETHTAFRV